MTLFSPLGVGDNIVPGEYRGQISMGSGSGGRVRRSFEVVDGGQPPSSDSMRTLRRWHTTSVTVVTTTDSGFRGVTVSAFSIVSLEPGRVLVCLDRQGDALDAVLKASRFAVSVLSDRQEFLADRFAGRAPLVDPQFSGIRYRLTGRGNPVLEECLVWFDCEVAAHEEWGDHVVVFGEVVEAGNGTGTEPLLYFDAAYRSLGLD